MDDNFEKRPRRPRIGEAKSNPESTSDGTRYERVDYDRETQAAQTSQPEEGYQPHYQSGGYQQRGYQQRGYQQRGYQQRGYQQRGYHQQGYQQGYQPGYEASMASEPAGDEQTEQQASGYQPRQQGGYQPRQQGGYRQQGGGYRQQGGYREQSGGYRQQGGYRQHGGGYRQQGGGYRQQGGGYRQQGGYREQGGYQQGGYQQGGYQQGGFHKRPKRKQSGPKPQMRFVPRPKPVEYEEPIVDPNMEVRLNKFLANAGVCSRREADEKIQNGEIKVNGTVVTELGVKITPKDIVEYDGKVVTTEKKCYILLNKPKNCVTTCDDEKDNRGNIETAEGTEGANDTETKPQQKPRKTVMDLVKGACQERIYPVGRLDRNTTGVLLLTNDGDLASKLTHPKYVKKKIYQVWTDKPISEEDMQHIADGVELDDGPIHADAVSYVSTTDRKQAGIEIHSGRNRVVRRIFETLGYRVVKLDRVYFAGLTKKNLARGRWRYLTQEEVNYLRQGSFE